MPQHSAVGSQMDKLMVGASAPQTMARSQMGRLQMLEQMARSQIGRKSGKPIGIQGKPIGVLANGRAIKKMGF